MSVPRYLARRLAFAGIASLLVVTVMFAVVAFFPDPPNSLFTPATPPLPGSPRDPSTPLLERYATWLVKYLTFEWGYTVDRTGAVPVTTTLRNALVLTGAYTVPALIVSGVAGTLLGMHAALNRGTRVDRAERLLAYAAFGIPGFFLGAVSLYLAITRLQWYYPYYDENTALTHPDNVRRLLLPATVLAVGTLAVGIRQVRSVSAKYLREDFVKLVRAQGGGSLLVARYVFRNAMAPLVSSLFSELLGVVLLSIIAIEVVFNLPGYGDLLVRAATDRQPALVMAVTWVTVMVGIGGVVLQDLVSVLVDPRVGIEEL